MLQRIDRAADSPLFLALMQQIQRAELSALYGEEARIDSGALEHGWRSVIRLPWQEELALPEAAA